LPISAPEAADSRIGRRDRDRLGVGLGLKEIAEAAQFAAQRLKILDDAVVHDGDPLGGDRVGVGLGRQPVRRPAGVANPYLSLHRLAIEPPGEIGELALGPPPLDAPIDQGRDPRGVIAPIFQPPQSLNESGRNGLLGDDANNSTHPVLYFAKPNRTSRPSRIFPADRRPVACPARTSASLCRSPGQNRTDLVKSAGSAFREKS